MTKACGIAIALLLYAGVATAQLAEPADGGVAMGQWQLNVRNMDASRTFWSAIGGTLVGKRGQSEVFSFPDVLVVLTPMAPSKPSTDTVVHHVGFQVPDVPKAGERFMAAGLAVEQGNPRLPQIFLTSPDGVRVEFLEDKMMPVPIRHHHVHWNVPETAVTDIQSWYVHTFDAKPGKRGNFLAADIPGANLTFGGTPDMKSGAGAPTAGAALDHIGFEVRGLEAFCKKLQAAGVKMDQPYSTPDGVGRAFLMDPWGTRIELTEGLARRAQR